jgi:hypothetical protein
LTTKISWSWLACKKPPLTLPPRLHWQKIKGSGKAICAGLEKTNGRIVYEVTIVSEGATTKFVVDPTSGRIKINNTVSFTGRGSIPAVLLVAHRADVDDELLNATFGPAISPPTNRATNSTAASKLPPIITKKPMLEL